MFDSIRKPMLLTMLGSDGRKYPFIAKAGEDIRQGLSIFVQNKLLGMLPRFFKAT